MSPLWRPSSSPVRMGKAHASTTANLSFSGMVSARTRTSAKVGGIRSGARSEPAPFTRHGFRGITSSSTAVLRMARSSRYAVPPPLARTWRVWRSRYEPMGCRSGSEERDRRWVPDGNAPNSDTDKTSSAKGVARARSATGWRTGQSVPVLPRDLSRCPFSGRTRLLRGLCLRHLWSRKLRQSGVYQRRRSTTPDTCRWRSPD